MGPYCVMVEKAKNRRDTEEEGRMSKKQNRARQKALEEERQREAQMQKNRRTGFMMLGVVIAMAVLTSVAFIFGGMLSNQNPNQNQEGIPVLEQGGNLVISTGEITDQPHFQPVSVDGTEIEIIVVRAGDGSIRTAVNACEGCYATGKGTFTAAGNELVCQNCGDHFTGDDIGLASTAGAVVEGQSMEGKCYPYPITDNDRTTGEDDVSISYDFLSSTVALMQTWENPS